MSNQIKIKHGNTAPQNSDLEQYELGWHGNYLYTKLPNGSGETITKIGTSNLTNIETSIDTMSSSIDTMTQSINNLDQSVDRIDTSIDNINVSIDNINVSIQDMDQEITTLDETTATIQTSLLNKITKPSVSGTSGQFLTSDGVNNTYWSTLNIVDNLTTQSPTETLSANMGYQLKLLIDQLGVDFIVAQGTSGDWTYRKWNSGIAECWLVNYSMGSIAMTAGYGNLYYRNSPTYWFPSGLFISTPTLVLTTMATQGLIFPSLHAISATTFAFYLASAYSETQTVYLSGYAKGKWK